MRLLPRRTVRLRLTAMYGVLFFVCGALLLALADGVTVSRSSSVEAVRSAGAAGGPTPVKHLYGQPPPSTTDPGLPYELFIAALIALGVMTVAALALGWVMAGRALRPVRKMTAAAQRISEENLHERLALTGPDDEFKELGDTMDGLLARLEGSFAAQRRFVANASHELRTPLTVMRTAIDVTLAKPSPTARQLTDMAVRVRRSVDQAESMVEALLTLAVSDQGKLSSEFTDLATWTEDAIDAAGPEIERLGLHVDALLDPAETTGDPQLLERMIWNLVDNAVRHNEPSGWIRLRTGSKDSAVYLEIANSGPFIPDDAVPSLFEPFRRMQDRTGVRDGVGLGLSIARSVVTAHRATVTARSQPAGGLDISVVIPRCLAVEPRPPAGLT